MLQLIRHLILILGFTLLTLGLLAWQTLKFDLSGLWYFAINGAIHPIIPLAFGIAIIPPTLREILLHRFGKHSGEHSGE